MSSEFQKVVTDKKSNTVKGSDVTWGLISSPGKLGFNLAKNGVELKIGIPVLFDELINILKVPQNPHCAFCVRGVLRGKHPPWGLKIKKHVTKLKIVIYILLDVPKKVVKVPKNFDT